MKLDYAKNVALWMEQYDDYIYFSHARVGLGRNWELSSTGYFFMYSAPDTVEKIICTDVRQSQNQYEDMPRKQRMNERIRCRREDFESLVYKVLQVVDDDHLADKHYSSSHELADLIYSLEGHVERYHLPGYRERFFPSVYQLFSRDLGLERYMRLIHR